MSRLQYKLNALNYLANKIKKMINPKMTYYFESCSKFHYSVFIKGWCKSNDTVKFAIQGIVVKTDNLSGFTWKATYDLPHLSEYNAAVFEIHILLKESVFPHDLNLDMTFSTGFSETLSISFIRERISKEGELSIGLDFQKMISGSAYKKILDIGGRARSGLDRSKEFPGKEVVVMDIIGGENVDVVGDAHTMSDFLAPNSFDAVYCVSVFEHLIMPWKVALEMNKVMRMGGIGLIHTHQTIGMHDLPWDFYRFSDTAWKGIFNVHTGFEIVKTQLKELQYVIPFVWREKYVHAERSAGFEDSTIIIRKISDTKLNWPLNANDVTKDMYPDTPDNNNGAS